MPSSSEHYFLTMLGVKAGKALGKLKKAIMYSLVQETGKDICYRCGEKIDTIDEFSIEHKEPWIDADDPIEKFYSLNNIAFSHMRCNLKASRKPGPYSRNKKYIKTLDN